MRLPYKKCSQQLLRTPGRRKMWGTAHIFYQSTLNAFSAFNNYQPMPMRKKTSPTVLKTF